MWKCPTCGEQIEDQFDKCWKCAKPDLTQEGAKRGEERRRGSFFCYWRRGWLILLMVFCLSLFVSGATYGLSALLEQDNKTMALVGAVASLGFVFLLLPAFAYWLFVFFLGKEAWPLPNREHVVSTEERAYALLEEAIRLGSQGRVNDALAKYQMIADNFGGTAAGRDAQKSIESLRAKIG